MRLFLQEDPRTLQSRRVRQDAHPSHEAVVAKVMQSTGARLLSPMELIDLTAQTAQQAAAAAQPTTSQQQMVRSSTQELQRRTGSGELHNKVVRQRCCSGAYECMAKGHCHCALQCSMRCTLYG